jgi:hypothetical protein
MLDTPLTPLDFPPAYRALLTIPYFTGDRVGAVGVTPAHLVAWRSLVSDRDATRSFRGLIATGTLPAQLYGLAGLYYSDPASLSLLAAPYLQSLDSVPTLLACFAGTTPVREIAEGIVAGAWPEALRRGLAYPARYPPHARLTPTPPPPQRGVDDTTCPYCKQPLRTPRAKQCRRCGRDWHA